MHLRSIALALLFAFLSWGCSSEAEVPKGPPNIVLVTLDTLRADRVGGDHSLTPSIDAFASHSTVFAGAITPIATTGPAHSSLFTGLRPRTHTVRWNGDSLPDKFATLATLLSETGYDTAAFVSMPMLINGTKLGRGFATTSEEGPYQEATRPGTEVNQFAKEWLKAPRNKPFFLWLHYFEVHSPYRLTTHAKQHLGNYAGFFANGASVDDLYSIRTGYPGDKHWSERNLAAINTLYDGEVVEADKLIADLLSALGISAKQSGPKDNTVVILTADHGQVLGEHHAFGHGFMTWEEALRVPLIIHDPHAEAREIDERVSLIDLFPTILDYARIPLPQVAVGRSLQPAVRGAELPRTLYLAETRKGTREQQAIVALEGSNKVVLGYERAGAFNLATDPHELRPMPVESSLEFERLAKIALEYFTQEPTAGQQDKPDQERLDELRSLGYTDSE